MRILIFGKVINGLLPVKTDCYHEIYSMLLGHLNREEAVKMHAKTNSFRLFTFTRLYAEKKDVHFYVAGEDSIVKDLVKHLVDEQIIRIGTTFLNLAKISVLPELDEKTEYTFRTDVIINICSDGKSTLAMDIPYVEERLRTNAMKKASMLGYEGCVHIKITEPTLKVRRYKSGHIFSWKCLLHMTGDYDVINTIYNVGCCENTATGSGFLWIA